MIGQIVLASASFTIIGALRTIGTTDRAGCFRGGDAGYPKFAVEWCSPASLKKHRSGQEGPRQRAKVGTPVLSEPLDWPGFLLAKTPNQNLLRRYAPEQVRHSGLDR